jgi:uncharacterized membrane protein
MLQSILILIWPAIAIRLGKTKLPDVFSPIVLCYLFGIILRNSGLFALDDTVSENWMNGSILMAIPILLYTTDIQRCIRYAGRSLLAFGLCIIGGLIGTGLTTFIYPIYEAPPWMLSGMLVGMYTGGTPNMQAIGMALGATRETIILVNAADIVCGGVWLVVLTSVAHRLLKGILPDFSDVPDTPGSPEQNANAGFSPADPVKAILLTLMIVAASIGICYWIFKDINHTAFLMLMLTTFGIAAAFLPAVKRWTGVYETGEYFLLMFCVALGLQADFSQVLENGAGILIFTAIALPLSIAFHLLLSRFFRIDRDTFLISSTAGVYGPAFIGQVASAIHNRQMIFPGIALGLLGYAVGNYLGIGLAYSLKWAIS